MHYRWGTSLEDMKETLANAVMKHSELHGHSLIFARERVKRIKAAHLGTDLIMDYQHEKINCHDYFYIGKIEDFIELNYRPLKGEENDN